ncbi:MAG: methyltransferase domain-containing protein [bacterium]
MGCFKTHDRVEIYQVIDLVEVVSQAKRDRNINILEVGCGDLRHLLKLKKVFKDEDLKLIGFDLSYTERTKTIARKENITLIRSLDEIQEDSLDIIFLFHVLEQVDKPIDFILSLKQKLCEDGYILISVSNDTRASKLIFRETWDYPPYRNYRFSEKTFDFIGRMTNLKIVQLKRYYLSLKNDFCIFAEGVKECIYSLIKRVKSSINMNSHELNLTTLRNNGSLSMVIIFRKTNRQKLTRIVVFDFDGTIIKEDSYIEYLQWISENKPVKILIKILFLAYRLKFVNNKFFKFITWNITYKRDYDKKFIEKFINRVNWNKNVMILRSIEAEIERNSKVYVISATPKLIISKFFELLLPDLYPNVTILGSNPFLPRNTLLVNLRHDNKREILKILGVDYIDDFYTNSIEEDEPLSKISKNTYIVS